MSSSTGDKNSHAETVNQALIALLEERGTGDYIVESISQLKHSLQSAHRVDQAGKYVLRACIRIFASSMS
jgi:predicted HD phosphohydrolase